jgi:hypothetical protein
MQCIVCLASPAARPSHISLRVSGNSVRQPPALPGVLRHRQVASVRRQRANRNCSRLPKCVPQKTSTNTSDSASAATPYLQPKRFQRPAKRYDALATAAAKIVAARATPVIYQFGPYGVTILNQNSTVRELTRSGPVPDIQSQFSLGGQNKACNRLHDLICSSVY